MKVVVYYSDSTETLQDAQIDRGCTFYGLDFVIDYIKVDLANDTLDIYLRLKENK